MNEDEKRTILGIGCINMAIANLGAKNGMGFAGVINAINLGNLNLIYQAR